MKLSKKAEQTRRKILDEALREFSEKGYQPVASFAFGAQEEERFHDAVRFAIKGALIITVLVEIVYIRPLVFVT